MNWCFIEKCLSLTHYADDLAYFSDSLARIETGSQLQEFGVIIAK